MLMKRILICILSVLLCVPFKAQNDPVVMTVNGYDVKKSEFEYFFKKNNSETKVTRKTVKQYAELYLNFKLKVQAAIDAGLDKSDSFMNEYGMYRDMHAEEYLIDTDFLEEKAHSIYERTVKEVGDRGLAHIYVISAIPDEEDPDSYEKCFNTLATVYEKLEAGESFQRLATEYSNDNLAEDGGDAGWVSASQLPRDIAEVAFSLETGSYSQPFISDGMGFIIKLDGRRQLGSFEDNRNDIYDYLYSTRYYDESKASRANAYAERLGWTVRDKEAVDYLYNHLEEIEPDFGNISREYHDGLLLFDISNREIWERVTNHPEEVEDFFNNHPEVFKYDKPCYKGMIMFCRDEDVYNQIKSVLDGLDMSQWVDSIVAFNRGDIKVRVMRSSSESGIFKQGQNAYVDKIVFGKDVENEPMSGYPYVNVVGRILNQPESVDDVAEEASEEYQKWLESEWIKKLRSQYSYKINKRALKKVSLK